MKIGKVYVRGAYGPGNLGDDVLMLCMINILSKKFSTNDILVGVEDVEVAKKFCKDANFIHFKEPCKVDLIVYGGGGQFFSFNNEGSSADQEDFSFLNKLKLFLSRNKNIGDAAIRIFFSMLRANENLVLAKRVASYCIGVGPFQNEGKGFKRFLDFTGKAEFISVRDKTSANYVRRISSAEPKVFTDPTFNVEDWYSGEKPVLGNSGEYITYVVRDWIFTQEGRRVIDVMIQHARLMQEKGKPVRLVSFHKNKDSVVLNKFSEFDWLVYDPAQTDITSFMFELIENSSALVSARAHGVWLPTILGCPVLAVGIEPKLYEVQKSLGAATMITAANSIQEFSIDFENYLEALSGLSKNIDISLSGNTQKAKMAKSDFLNWISI